jgi:hypothetical protein
MPYGRVLPVYVPTYVGTGLKVMNKYLEQLVFPYMSFETHSILIFKQNKYFALLGSYCLAGFELANVCTSGLPDGLF